ncbi:hypothetical protein BGZ60DRAFT_228931 [Tricladium varicosporioides]|nr:hypothetical protein BGZ60DRAFT_228931 [Hymenoscyphus varicosporioides]
MAMILPKGIVVNSPQIAPSIERSDEAPLEPEQIARFWKVYTTTKRRLLDPTAERLENYWWRIWGSRSRELDGATVARLFSQISDGETFVPLRGPPNRDEGTPPLRNTRHAPGAASASTLHLPGQSRPSTTSSSSASRPPTAMPPPILKKTRGPSNNGPRPTARFISPHESEKETEPDSSVGSNSHVVVQPPSPEGENTRPERKVAGAGPRKKTGFVASSGAKKKRPVIVRRQNSQASQTSQSSTESGRITDSGGSMQSPLQKTPPSISGVTTARIKQTTPSKFQENFSPTLRSPATQAKGQSSSKGTPSPRKPAARRSQKATEEPSPDASPGPSQRPQPLQDKQAPVVTFASDKKQEETPSGSDSTEEPKETQNVRNERSQVLHKSLRSRSDGEKDREMGAIRVSKSTASLAPTLAAATGHNAVQNETSPTVEASRSLSSSSTLDKGKGRDLGERSRSDIFAKRAVQPVLASSTFEPPGSMSRSKSQLSLLLEKDRARTAENSITNGKRDKRH